MSQKDGDGDSNQSQQPDYMSPEYYQGPQQAGQPDDGQRRIFLLIPSPDYIRYVRRELRRSMWNMLFLGLFILLIYVFPLLFLLAGGLIFHSPFMLVAGVLGIISFIFTRCPLVADPITLGSFFFSLPSTGWKIIGSVLLVIGIVHWVLDHTRPRNRS